MPYDTNDKKTILYRLGYLLAATCFGFLPVLFVREWISEPWDITFNTVLWFIFMSALGLFSLYFLYHSLFFKRISQKQQETIRTQNRQKLEKLAALCMEQHHKINDTPAVILLENLFDFEELENRFIDNLDDVNEQNGRNFPLLCKQGENRYVITFPFGVSRLFLYEFADDISVFCTCSLHLWAKPELFKMHSGECIYLCVGSEDLLVAVTEDDVQWKISPDEAMLHRSKKHDRSYRAFPDLDWGTLERHRFL